MTPWLSVVFPPTLHEYFPPSETVTSLSVFVTSPVCVLVKLLYQIIVPPVDRPTSQLRVTVSPVNTELWGFTVTLGLSVNIS